MKRVLLYLLSFVIIVIGGFVIFVLTTWNKKHQAPYPDIKASTDSAIIARGKYLVFGPAHCADCHGDVNQLDKMRAGEMIPLSGGTELPLPPATLRFRNITPDKETGIGRFSDGEIARTLRHSVGTDGRVIFPIMPFQNLSDDDLTAIISFIRSQPAVRHDVKPTEYTFLGKAILALGLITPEGPTGTPPKSVHIDTTVAYGSYLANSVANCVGCHTNRDLKTGKFIGPAFAGGFLMPADALSDGYSFITPNLTPHPVSGRLKDWNETAFVNRFRLGRVHKTSPMAWDPFSRMTESDLKALYRYLNSLPPVDNTIAKTVFAPGEELPK